MQKENQAHCGPAAPAPGGAMAAAQVLVCAEASLTLSAAPSRQPSFEKLMVESEDQRPAAKRQLSSESAARTITVVKKSTVRKEAEEQRQLKPKTHLGQKVAPCAAGTGKRKRRKELFTNSEVFHRVDDHVIRTGAEVRTLLIFTLTVTVTDTNLCHIYTTQIYSLEPPPPASLPFYSSQAKDLSAKTLEEVARLVWLCSLNKRTSAAGSN